MSGARAITDRVARVALSRLSEPGDPRLSSLVAELGAARVYTLLLEEQDVAGVYTDVAARLRGLDPRRELDDAAAAGIRFVCPGDEEWPAQLADLDRAGQVPERSGHWQSQSQSRSQVHGRGGTPLGLWLRGPLRLHEAVARSVAVVGSRSATSYGTSVAADLSAAVAREGWGVVSGAAFGIDQAAHRAALAVKGPTVAVLACGVDRPYPAAHKQLLDYIADVGLVASELPPGCAPTRLRFLTRNRLIAALTQGTTVVEAAVRSGALSTANWATRMNRVLMGVPGPVTSAPSQGVHELIRTRQAALVTRGCDVLELLAPAGSYLAPEARGAEVARDRLGAQERQLLEAVPVVNPAAADSIARTAALDTATVERLLPALRERGLVRQVGTRWRLERDVPQRRSDPA
ncbi:MAG TPA: DNA-processing protein DprA [Nocardioidaceae bacterium]|nr:DNA-processing protein DprA [Nocardioidaceae bacterium]